MAKLERVLAPVELPARTVRDEEFDEDPGPGERELDEMVHAADESRDEPERPGVHPAETQAGIPAAAEVRQLFSELEIRPTESGGLRIEASADAAATLSALFGGLAKALEDAARR